ncbi:39S ribosomal protein L30 mitochondrial [Schistosoma japonicum]|nr:39S ribosomal protein L30 mitochondrial [Schistosoma japonicum]KAH8861881.1 39S ribosomal protein L30 mitochondrial [Schistosoma japonicum]KAH8861885.1 39S ribosomal protein L30 mitochondrial [Schistosoma japonicum]KAH8861886.1 39S ribosomal protein L30 mitochondrial [Schistosoma japonicum]KAH8861888.1 39S ribosomal protein L30 mitochondrial [Schistosoma japonicum]
MRPDGIMSRSWTMMNFEVICRLLHVSLHHNSMSYTKESKLVPGSDDHKNPLGWAKRLFRLSESPPAENQSDKPPLLHMVCRLKPLKGIIHYERAILEKYGLGRDTKNHSWVVVKNIPSVNRDLYEIKHLVRIQPVIFKNGLPSESDLLTCRLLPDGRFFRHRGLSVDSKSCESSVPNETNLSICSVNTLNSLKVSLIKYSLLNTLSDSKYLLYLFYNQVLKLDKNVKPSELAHSSIYIKLILHLRD